MTTTRLSSLFKKSSKLMQKRGKNLSKMEEVLSLLLDQQALPAKYRDHKLTGDYDGCRECHIEPDWLLIYRLEDDTLLPTGTGSLSKLFG